MNQSSKVDLVGVEVDATDTLIRLPHYPALGSKVEFRSADVLPGGQVASAVAACQQWGLRTRYVGKVGDDDAARIHRAEFDKLGRATLLTATGCASQQAVIWIDGCRRARRNLEARRRINRDRKKSAANGSPRPVLSTWKGHDTAAAVLAAGWASPELQRSRGMLCPLLARVRIAAQGHPLLPRCAQGLLVRGHARNRGRERPVDFRKASLMSTTTPGRGSEGVAV